MKTSVEQLMIDLFGENFRVKINDSSLNAFQVAIEKEKEQIIDAFEAGFNEANSMYQNTFSLDYYNQTYNQNK
jgi:hypothetical protein